MIDIGRKELSRCCGSANKIMSIKFSENLKKLRKNTGLTQKQLAAQLNVALSTVAMWETGSRQPDYKMLNKIAEFFDVTFDNLLGDHGEKKVAEEEIYVAYDDEDLYSLRDLLRTRPEMKMLFSVSKKATKEDIERTVAIIEALKGKEFSDQT